ncbi:MAG TPA: FeoB-associated Cys-rich membrane protein [Candidatus Pelethocola excrementipullorum]|nr:FeoB-associated Cys-rich membrane protein [Candidatus Pelethocola excrementipullorum]
MNAGTIIVLVVLLGVVSLVIRKIVKDKKAGKTCSSCGGNCSACSPSTKAAVHDKKH